MRRLSLLLALSAASALAAPTKYTVQTQLDNLNVMTVESETDLENFTGRTSAVSGTVTFDPAAKTGSANVVVNGKTISTGVAGRDGHMRGPGWLNFDAVPNVRFQTTAVKWLKDDTYEVRGNLTLNGVTKPLTTTATVKLTSANDTTRSMKLGGDALAVTTKFSIKLSDYGVTNRTITAGRVSNVLPITLKFIASNK